MSIKQAIDKATERARREVDLNDCETMFVVWDEPYKGAGRYIVMDEWHYTLGQGIGDIDLATAIVWSDGDSVEVERYK